MDWSNVNLEPEQLDLLKTLVAANDNVPSEERKEIRGVRGDGTLTLFHSGFPSKQLTPNEFDLTALHHAGLIHSYRYGRKNGWRVDILPAARQYLASGGEVLHKATTIETTRHESVPSVSSPDALRDPKVEAIQTLEQLVNDVEQNDPTLESVLRRCTRVARLIGQPESADLFSKEIRGYLDTDTFPYYRHIRGIIQWRTMGFARLNDPSDVAAVMASRLYGNDSCELVVWSGIDRIRSAAQDGFWQVSKTVQSRQVPKINLWVEGVEYYAPLSFRGCLKTIEQVAYDWAVQWLTYLRYESRITSIWQQYRSSVDAKMEEISLTNHLRSIDQNLASSNQQDWRNVLYGCRSVLQDTANFLWRDKRDEYQPIQVRGDDGKKRAMRVTQSDYVNRIQAYLHQKSTKGTETDLVEAEAEYLGALFVRLNKLDNHAHSGASREMAQSVAIHTYILLAELIRQTDMQPIEHYED